MKRVIIAALIVSFIAGCAATHIPEWKSAAFRHMEAYKKHALTGDDRMADMYFSRALAEIKKSGDLEVLARAHLLKYALRAAMLDPPGDDAFTAIHDIEDSRENAAYFAFLTGGPEKADVALLPPQYGPFIAAFQRGAKGEMNAALAGMDDPLSRLIAAGIAVTHQRFNEDTLTLAADTASGEGWKKALLVYLSRLESLYKEKGNEARALLIGKRIALIKD